MYSSMKTLDINLQRPCCLCVCVCVCTRESGREGEREREEGGERERAQGREGGREREEMRTVEINLQRPCHQWHRP
jgi:hypothetical protein